MTLQVDETLIQAADETDIFNADSQRISFAQIPDWGQIPVDVTYEGGWSGDGITATRLLVRPLPQ
jgi:hypothetical protein